jgi:phage host-nuclease inhibitor protein Gam
MKASLLLMACIMATTASIAQGRIKYETVVVQVSTTPQGNILVYPGGFRRGTMLYTATQPVPFPNDNGVLAEYGISARDAYFAICAYYNSDGYALKQKDGMHLFFERPDGFLEQELLRLKTEVNRRVDSLSAHYGQQSINEVEAYVLKMVDSTSAAMLKTEVSEKIADAVTAKVKLYYDKIINDLKNEINTLKLK